MALDRFNENMDIIAGLGDDPKRDDGLSTPQFKSVFDKAGLLIQKFLNDKLIPQIENFLDEGTVLGKITEALSGKLDKTGGTMQGSINMNGQRLTGLNAPTEDNEAATKGFVENAVKNVDVSGKVDKANVVNNFTTTEEGFVADARALKVLNDSKLFMELVWENDSPMSDFVGGREITYASGYEKYRLELNAHYGRIGASIDFKPGEGLVASLMWGDDGIYVSRSFETTANSLKANDGYQSKVVNNSVMVPVRIYGIKGVL